MNTPLVLMAVPFAGALAAYLVWPRDRRLGTLVGVVTSGSLALFVLWLPVGAPIHLLGIEIPVTHSLSVLGREFTLESNGRPALVFLHLAGTFLFAGTLAARVRRLFIPICESILGLMTAALFVRPFLYAAVFLALSAAAFAGILSDPSHPRPRGASRLLAFVILGMPFILLAGSQLSASDQIPADPAQLHRILVLLGIGFAFLLSFPPFHFWLPDIADDSPPYAVAFVVTLFQGAVLFFLLRFLDEFAWLRTVPEVYTTLEVAGIAMCLVGGILALVQTRLGRLTGYVVLANLGVILLALSTARPEGVEIALVMLALRGLALGVWGLALHVLRERGPADDVQALRGRAAVQPLASAAVILAGLSLAGLPGLAGFPGNWAALRLLAATAGSVNMRDQVAIAVSMIACEIAFLRLASAMLWGGASPRLRRDEAPVPSLYLGAGMLLLVAIGLAPQTLVPLVARAADLFSHLAHP